MKNESALCGEKVMVYPLNQSNLKNYLTIYKKASAFSEIYDTMPDFWKKSRRCIENDAVGEKSSKARHLIVEKKSSQGCGYIELDYDNPKVPEVAIAVLKKYQRKGYAFEATRILLENIFEKETVECVRWNAFFSNTASCRLAEKLGGVIVEEKNLIVEAMLEAGFTMASLNDKEIPKTITYEIKTTAKRRM